MVLVKETILHLLWVAVFVHTLTGHLKKRGQMPKQQLPPLKTNISPENQ